MTSGRGGSLCQRRVEHFCEQSWPAQAFSTLPEHHQSQPLSWWFTLLNLCQILWFGQWFGAGNRLKQRWCESKLLWCSLKAWEERVQFFHQWNASGCTGLVLRPFRSSLTSMVIQGFWFGKTRVSLQWQARCRMQCIPSLPLNTVRSWFFKYTPLSVCEAVLKLEECILRPGGDGLD